jgi:hypothetical protein
MLPEILSVAIFDFLPGKEQQCLTTLRELFSALAAGGYSRDLLYRDDDMRYVLLRYWKSDEGRRAAQEDPEVQRCWAKLGNDLKIVKVYETLKQASLP